MKVNIPSKWRPAASGFVNFQETGMVASLQQKKKKEALVKTFH
jgi:hypothetical protein